MKKIFTVIILLSFSYLNGQGLDWIKEHYTKKEYKIEMRDGAKLFTSVYTPKDTTKTYPIILTRTPYTVSPYGEEKYPRSLGPNDEMTKEGNIFVFQDVRGRFLSEGEFDNMRGYIPNKKNKQIDESSDTYDTIDWLVKNVKHNNGNVGMWGISYPGFYAAMSLMDSHPALKAVSPQAPIADWFIGDDMHHGGALSLSMTFNFFKSFGLKRDSLTTQWKSIDKYASPDMYTFFLNLGSLANIEKLFYKDQVKFWKDVVAHPNYDEFWKSRSNLPYFTKVKPAVLLVGGWYDSEDLYGPLHIYESIEQKNIKNDTHLIMGPWSHGGWSRSNGSSFGDFSLGENTSETYNQKYLTPFFNYYLKGEGHPFNDEVVTFRTGVNSWQTYKSWPPVNTEKKSLFINGKNLSWEKPTNKENSYCEFISDPSRPVPYTAKFYDSQTMYNRTYMSEDQRFAFSRPDVLSFSTQPLDQDVTIAGPIQADLFVSTTGTDADWVVKLIDVFPDDAKDVEQNTFKSGGYQRLIRFEILRGRYRKGFEKPAPFKPNEISEVKINLNDVDHTFLKGHKIMMQIQSSFFPFFDRNPQKFVDIYNAKEDDFQKATHRVFFSDKNPTCITFNVVK